MSVFEPSTSLLQRMSTNHLTAILAVSYVVEIELKVFLAWNFSCKGFNNYRSKA